MNSLKMNFIHWTPRIICIIAILFVSIFAFDAFDTCCTIWDKIAAFLMHMIPSFVLLIVLLIAWKFEFVGGILLTIIGLVLSPIIFIHNYHMNDSVWMSLGIILTITFPFIVTGILFIISHYKKKKMKA